MSKKEKRALLIRLEGESNVNIMPVTASGVGYDVEQLHYIHYDTATSEWIQTTGSNLILGTINADNLFVSGVVTASLGFSGSLTQLSDGSSYLIAGTNITITSSSNGPITISSTGGGGATTGTFNVPAPAEFVTTASVAFAGSELGFGYTADSVGTDTYFFASGSVGSKDGATPGVAVFGGDVVASGTVFAPQGLSGSLTKLTDGTDYLQGGTNISVTTGSDGSVTVSLVGDPEVVDPEFFYANTTDSLQWTSTTWTDVTNVASGLTDQRKSSNINRTGSTFTVSRAGKYYWRSDFNAYAAASGGSYVGFRLSGSNGTLAQHTVYIVNTANDSLETRGIVNTVLDLQAGESFDFEYAVSAAAGNWVSTTLDGETTVSGDIAMFRIPGTSEVEPIVTGTFNVPSPAEFVTTASVAFAGSELGFGYTADSVGADTYFFASGSIGAKDGATPGVAVFGGDVVASGTVYAPQGLSGSLTQLADGTSYLIAGTNVTITSTSNGPITISSTGGGGGGSGYWFEKALDLIFTTGSAEVTGTLSATQGLSGSLTKLTDGRSYLVGELGIAITSESNGPVTASKYLRDLITFIDEGPACGFAGGYKETGPTGPFPTQSIWYTDSGKTNKIVQLIVTWSGPVPTTYEWTAFKEDGTTVDCRVTDSITYTSSIFETTRDRTIT